MNKILGVILGFPKTLRLNFCLFGIKKAVLFPIVLAPNVKVNWKSLYKGAISLSNYKPGIVNIGFFEGVGATTSNSTVIDIRGNGHICLLGKTCIARGSYFLVDNADVSIGKDFHGGNNLKLIARKKISIGDNVLTSWDCTIMDSDGHDIYNMSNNTIINTAKEISIGNNVWIGANVYILKGTLIPDSCVVAARSFFSSQELDEKCSIYGNSGNDVRLLQKKIYWKQ